MIKGPSDRLQQARRNAGFQGPAEAAERFGWNKSTYKSHENGTRGLRSEPAARYARAFHVSRAWLLTGEGDDRRQLSAQEEKLLGQFRALPENERGIVEMFCDGLFRRQLAPPEPEPGPIIRQANRGR